MLYCESRFPRGLMSNVLGVRMEQRDWFDIKPIERLSKFKLLVAMRCIILLSFVKTANKIIFLLTYENCIVLRHARNPFFKQLFLEFTRR